MQTPQLASTTAKRERKRVEAVVETLADMQGNGESLAELAHDARNMVTALVLYCELLEDPGVLAPQFLHYAQELKLVTAASRRLVEKLVLLDKLAPTKKHATRSAGTRLRPACAEIRALPGTQYEAPAHPPIVTERLPNDPIDNLQQEVLANRNLLDAMAGLGIAVTVTAEGGARAVRLNSEDLTRILVNLVKNATESMHANGSIHIGLQEKSLAGGNSPSLLLTVEDSGPGIPEAMLETVFEPGYTTRTRSGTQKGWPVVHRGLGLSISRSIVEAAGGTISVRNGARGGACFSIDLPARGK